MVRCTVAAVSVDISLNGAGAAAAAALLECADAWVGRNHLFKRSMLLLKAMLNFDVPEYHPSRPFLNESSAGTFSSWCLSIMMLSLLNSHPIPVDSPLRAVVLFVEEYADFDWGTHMITMDGPVHMYLNTRPRPTVQPRFITRKRLHPFRQFAHDTALHKQDEQHFDIRSVNVQDPLRPAANAARSVSRAGLQAISAGLQAARTRFRQLLFAVHEHRAEEAGVLDSPAVLAALHSILLGSVGNLFQARRPDTLPYKVPEATTGLVASPGTSRGDAHFARFMASVKSAGPTGLSAPLELWSDPTHLKHTMQALQFAYLQLSDSLSTRALQRVLAGILARTGPLTVGQVGRVLQDLCGGGAVLAKIKEAHGGLKRFLQSMPSTFTMAGDHAFNPLCSLVGHTAAPKAPATTSTQRTGGRAGGQKSRKQRGSTPSSGAPPRGSQADHAGAPRRGQAGARQQQGQLGHAPHRGHFSQAGMQGQPTWPGTQQHYGGHAGGGNTSAAAAAAAAMMQAASWQQRQAGASPRSSMQRPMRAHPAPMPHGMPHHWQGGWVPPLQHAHQPGQPPK